MMKTIFRQLPLVAAIAAAPMLNAQVANQKSNTMIIEEVLVTAQKRSESLQEIPIAITAYGEATLEAKGAADIAGLSATVPSLTFAPYPSSSNALILFMRGQGANDVGQITKEGAVGMYIDGVYMARPQSSSMDLADIERIEVLRGPQGTLYGRNTTGGAINIHTKKPSGELNFKEHLSIGNQGRVRSLTTLDLPAVGDVAAKLSYLNSRKDGYVDNVGGMHDFGEAAQEAVRLALRWELSDSFSADYAVERGDIESTPIYYQNDMLASPSYSTKPHKKSSQTADLPESSTDFNGQSLTLTWDLNDNLSIKSISGYRELDTHYYQDYMNAAFVAYGYKTDDNISSRQWSQEFQFVGSALESRLEYVAGLYMFNETASHLQKSNIGDFLFLDRDVDTENDSAAAYAQVSYTPNVLEDKLTVTTGLRYTEDDRKGVRSSTSSSESNVKNDQSYESVDPILTLSYQINGEMSTYAKMVTAYKSGGFAEASSDFKISYDPEEITSYELGFKSYLFDRRVRLNVAGFISDYDNMQLDLSPNPAQIFIVNTYNAGTAEISGIEIDVMWQASQNLQLSLDYSYLDWEIEEVVNPGTGADETNEFSLPYAPQHAYTANANYQVPNTAIGDFDFNIAYSWQDDIYNTAGTSSNPSVKKDWEVEAYGLVNARLSLSVAGIDAGDLRIALWSKNLQDKDYAAHRFTAGAGSVVAWNEPRSYGIDFIYEY
jgi:iron complex outermembrane receptor protein